MRRRSPAAIAALTLSAAMALVLAACSQDSEEDSTVRDETGAVQEGGDVGVFRLQVGDCFNSPALTPGVTTEVQDVAALPCDEPHENEVYDAFDMTESTYPGVEATNTIANEGCLERFEAFVGLAYEQSIYGILTLTPTEQSWETGDREVLCILADAVNGELITGSVKGTAK